jgi:hypothetical protein
MCDYSLHNVKSRPAKVGDRLKLEGHPVVRAPTGEARYGIVIHAQHGAFSYMPLPRSDDAEWPKDKDENAPIDRQRHLPPAQSGGRRMPPAPNRMALTTRKETMNGI